MSLAPSLRNWLLLCSFLSDLRQLQCSFLDPAIVTSLLPIESGPEYAPADGS